MSNDRDAVDEFARGCILAGSVLMLLGVICGAFGSHLLASRVSPKQLASFQTGSLYHLLHALGLVLLGVIAKHGGVSRWLRVAAGLMTAGIVCFSGSIYLITLGAPRGLGMIAPFGGLSFMAAWACLALHVLRRPGPQAPGST